MVKRPAVGLLGVVVIALAACADPDSAGTDLLFLQSGRAVTVVAAGSSNPSFRALAAAPSHDWSTVVQAVPSGKSTRVVAVDPTSGEESWSLSASGRLEVKVVSPDGGAAVLEPRGPRYMSNPSTTRLVIARRGSTRPETIELRGNFAPEAFSTDAQSLFVVQYLPARNPNRYQVRRLDLSTGAVDDVYSVDAELQEAMRGTARIQAMSPDGTRLYTLYTLRSRGTSHAFIHVLSLDELWAHCVDLPEAFAGAPQKATALTVAPDGKRLYVANARRRLLAEIDTEQLAVTRTATVDFAHGKGAHAAHGSGSALYLAGGTKVTVVETKDLDIVRSWGVDFPVTGLQPSAEDRSLYVGHRTRISVFDPSSGKSLGGIEPPGAGEIGILGKVIRPLGSVRTEIVCAC